MDQGKMAAKIQSVFGPSTGRLKIGDQALFTVNFDQDVVVDINGGIPYLELSNGARAEYVGIGEDGTTLTFRYVVAEGDPSTPDLEVFPGSLVLDGATISNENGDAHLEFVPGTDPEGEVEVDAIRPSLAGIDVTGELKVGGTVTFSFTFSEEVDGFDFSDIASSGVTLDPSSFVQDPDDPTLYTVQGTLSGTVTIGLEDGSFGDLAGNDGLGDTLTFNVVGRTPAPALGGRKLLQSRGGRVLARVLLHPLPPMCSNTAPAPHQHGSPKQVALDYQGIEAGQVPLRLGTAWNHGMLDERVLLTHASASELQDGTGGRTY